MYLFSQQGLKNLKISRFFLVFRSSFACSLQNPPTVTSFAAVTNLPTIMSLLSATSSCPSRNSHIFSMRSGHFSRVLSVPFSSLGVRNGHLPLSCVRRYTIASNCFSAAATFFFSLLGPLALLVELVIVRSMPRNHRHSCQKAYYRVIVLYFRIKFQLPSEVRHLK